MRASNDFGDSHYGIQTIKMGFNYFEGLRTFGHLELHCTLSIEALHKLNMHFDCGYLELLNACIFGLVYIVLNVRDRTESKCPSIVFLSILIYWWKI